MENCRKKHFEYHLSGKKIKNSTGSPQNDLEQYVKGTHICHSSSLAFFAQFRSTTSHFQYIAINVTVPLATMLTFIILKKEK